MNRSLRTVLISLRTVLISLRPVLISLRPVLITGAVAAITIIALHYWLSPENYMNAPWLPQVAVTLIGLVGASWFAYRRLEILDEGNSQRKRAADEQLAATERANLNDAIKNADEMMAKPALSSIIAGQRWLHHLAEDDRLDAGLIRSLLCAYIVGSDPGSTSADETKRRTRQAALEMLFGSPGRNRYSRCQDEPELGSCTWGGLDFTDLHAENVNFRIGNFTNAKISGARFDRCNLRETKWSGDVGGSARTSMHGVEMCGAEASSCTFENIDFSNAQMGSNGLITRFKHCTFRHCDFSGAVWSGAEFDTSSFEGCLGITYDLCRDAKLKDCAGLPNEVLYELRRKRVGGY